MAGDNSNFAVLERIEPQAFRLGLLAERYFTEDPNTCQVKLRQLSELIAQLSASRFGLTVEVSESFSETLRRLKIECSLPRDVGDIFHSLRMSGNRAAHNHVDDHSDALTGLKLARQLAIWYARTFFEASGKFGPFVPPPRPADANADLAAELERLQSELAAARSEAERLRAETAASEDRRQAAAEQAEAARQDQLVWETLAEEAEKDRIALAERLQAALAMSRSAGAPDRDTIAELARDAADAIDLDEAGARALIDRQLRNAGWEVDTPILRHSLGGRPLKGQNRAIAEWPTASGPADYALFCGLTLVGTIEAKRQNRNVMAVLRQAERYASDIHLEEAELAAGGPARFLGDRHRRHHQRR